MARARASVAKTRALSRYNAGQATNARRGLLVGRRTTKAGTTRRHVGIGNYPGLDRTKGKTHVVDIARGSGVLTFRNSGVKKASGGLKARYGKMARAHSRKLDKKYGVKGVGVGRSRKVGTGTGGKKRTRMFSPGGVFNRLHPRGRGGRFVRK